MRQQEAGHEPRLPEYAARAWTIMLKNARRRTGSADIISAHCRSTCCARCGLRDAGLTDNQLPPSGEGWRIWLMMAGRGFGKTRAGAEWIHRLASGKPGVRIALVGATIADARSIMVEGVSGLLAIARRYRQRAELGAKPRTAAWPNGSEAQLFSGDNADGLRGPEHDFAWCDELAKWRQAEETWNNLQFGLRRGTRPRALVTTTPRPMRLLERDQRRSDWTVTTHRADERQYQFGREGRST